MNRCLIFLCALLLSAVTIGSACAAASSEWLRFTLRPDRGGSEIQATFSDEGQARGDSRWSAGFPPSELIGFDSAGFRAVGARPLRFAVIREAGRLDCRGTGGNALAQGYCGFTPNPGFMQLLAGRGIGTPTREQAFGLMALDVRRDLIDAVAAARYPAPSINDLMAMTAVGVSGHYIRELARAGYRPRSIDSLVQFKALNITPEFVGGFVRIGYAHMDPEDLVQLKALDITPAWVAGFQRIGYGGLPVDTLVQFKALNITPEFVQAVDREPGPLPSASELVERKVLGRRR
ncbi:MAG: hypothetical protein ACJ8FL_08325 [Sphingomicrobium sp.]